MDKKDIFIGYEDISEIEDAIELGLPLENEYQENKETKEVKELVKEENKKEVKEEDFIEVIYESKEKAERYYAYRATNDIEDDDEIYIITDDIVRYLTERIKSTFGKVERIDIRDDRIIIEEKTMEWSYYSQSMKEKYFKWYVKKI